MLWYGRCKSESFFRKHHAYNVILVGYTLPTLLFMFCERAYLSTNTPSCRRYLFVNSLTSFLSLSEPPFNLFITFRYFPTNLQQKYSSDCSYFLAENVRTITIAGEQTKLTMNDAEHFMVTPLPDMFCGNKYYVFQQNISGSGVTIKCSASFIVMNYHL